MTENDIESYIEYQFKGDILYARYVPDINITLERAKLCVEQRLEYTRDKQVPVLIDGRQLKSMDKAARDYLSSRDGSRGLLTAALLTDTPLTNFMANFFVKVNVIKAPFPVRLFTKESEAIKWLKTYQQQ
ncbi:MAG: hypothetical protein H6585_06395 [Flavobacteriales bacterium]|nr:hypothetical protein [Flavobacteriales bacterium]MCB9447958.1 hypothetical protein [Flavobacteriales bacterium]